MSHAAPRGPDRGDQLRFVVAAFQADELVERRASDDAVDRESGVALELTERA